MRELFDTRLNPDDKPMTQAQLAERKNRRRPVPDRHHQIDASVLSKSGEQLSLLRHFGNGVSNLDLALRFNAESPSPIRRASSPRIPPRPWLDSAVPSVGGRPQVLTDKDWTGWSPRGCSVIALGQRLGIIGMGRIGQAVASRALPGLNSLSQSSTGGAEIGKARRNLLGKSTRCWRAWISCRSIVTAPATTIYSRHAD